VRRAGVAHAASDYQATIEVTQPAEPVGSKYGAAVSPVCERQQRERPQNSAEGMSSPRPARAVNVRPVPVRKRTASQPASLLRRA